MKLVKSIHYQTLKQLANFSDSNEAYEKRGMTNGVNLVVQAIDEIKTFEELKDDRTRSDIRSELERDKYDRAAGL